MTDAPIPSHQLHATGTDRFRGHLAMFTFAALIAGSFSFGRLALPYVDPAPLNAARYIIHRDNACVADLVPANHGHGNRHIFQNLLAVLRGYDDFVNAGRRIASGFFLRCLLYGFRRSLRLCFLGSALLGNCLPRKNRQAPRQ